MYAIMQNLQFHGCALLTGCSYRQGLYRKVLMDNIIKVTPNQIQTNSAKILKEKQEQQAHDLKLSQQATAHALRQKTYGPLTREATNARDALEKSQNESAAALKKSQNDLAAVHKKSNQDKTDNAQAIALLSGGYSINQEEV